MSTGSKNSGKWQTTLVEQMDMEDEVLKLFKDGKSSNEISDMMKSKGKNLSPYAIKSFLKSARQEFKENKSLETAKKVEDMVTNYREELNSILEEVKGMKDLARESGNMNAYDRMIGRLYQGLDLLAKLTGDYKETKTVDINIVIDEINRRTFMENKEIRNKLHQTELVVDAEILEQEKELSKYLEKEQ